MDLQVYAVIAIVFLVSLCSLLYVNKQLRGGKTYEEVLAEKRQFEKLYGPKKKNVKKANAGGKKVWSRDAQNSDKISKLKHSQFATIVTRFFCFFCFLLFDHSIFYHFENNEPDQLTEMYLSQNRDRNSNKEKSPKQQTLAIESDQKSESGSELEQTNEQPKLHVEFTEAEIITTDTYAIAFKVKFY